MEPLGWVVAGVTGIAAWIAVRTNRAGDARLRDWVAAATASGLNAVRTTRDLVWRRELQATRGTARGVRRHARRSLPSSRASSARTADSSR